MIPDLAGPMDSLNSGSISAYNSSAFRLEPAHFFGLDVFSLLRCRGKSNPKSTEGSSSFSLAGDIIVKAVTEIPLLSKEFDVRPSPRDSEEPT